MLGIKQPFFWLLSSIISHCCFHRIYFLMLFLCIAVSCSHRRMLQDFKFSNGRFRKLPWNSESPCVLQLCSYTMGLVSVIHLLFIVLQRSMSQVSACFGHLSLQEHLAFARELPYLQVLPFCYLKSAHFQIFSLRLGCV